MGPDEAGRRQRVLLIAAHYDDEVIGAGAQFSGWGPRLTILHVTDSAPAGNEDGRRAGFETPEAYSAERRREAIQAGRLAGIDSRQYRLIGVRDQEACRDLVGLARRIRIQIDFAEPDLIITHPYEGGHPDHDATAFAVHCALAATHGDPAVWEWTGYHAAPDGSMATGRFAGSGGEERIFELSETQCRFKQRMFDCFATQRRVLENFGTAQERFRPAPEYDFTRPPNRGLVFYEQFDWGMTASRFCQLAAAALQSERNSLCP